MNATLSHRSATPASLDADTLRRVGELVTSRALAAAAILLVMGFLMGLGHGPWDQNQLAMLHVPAVWVAMLLLLSAAFWAAIALVLERDAAHVLVQAIVPTGGMFAFLALWSGALWVKSLYGVWWLGSAREWASLALLMVYLAMLSLPALIDLRRRADRLVSVLALLGVSQVLLTYFSTEWWNAGSAGPKQLAVVSEMFPAMFAVAMGLWAYATATAGMRMRSLLLERKLAPATMARWH
jgi:heme exporter protein C